MSSTTIVCFEAHFLHWISWFSMRCHVTLNWGAHLTSAFCNNLATSLGSSCTTPQLTTPAVHNSATPSCSSCVVLDPSDYMVVNVDLYDLPLLPRTRDPFSVIFRSDKHFVTSLDHIPCSVSIYHLKSAFAQSDDYIPCSSHVSKQPACFDGGR